MKLNRFGKLQMNNPARAAAQRRYTAQRMLQLGGDVSGGTALEIGCGRGVGAGIVLTDFRAARVVAFDIDPDLVAIAKRRLVPHGDRTRVYAASATAIPESDHAFDAVFDFGVIHQIEEWRKAVTECARVLKPGGNFYFESVSKPFYRLPMNLAMERGTPDVRRIGFDRDAYIAELTRHGVVVGSNYFEPKLPITGTLVGDLIGVGTLTA